MTTDPRRVEELFARAHDLSSSERAGFLDEVCGDDRSLHEEVTSLLRAYAAAGEELEGIVARAARPHAPRGVEPASVERGWVGRTCGAWRLVDFIGSGGMGAVYLAERSDGQFQQRAALKLMRGGVFDEKTLEGFHREREVLARLEHPGIARLIDGGSLAGQPYLVMEYVEGEPIDQWCDARDLGVSERLQLFQAVCAALHYAHSHLVVHLDVKPKNILVTEAGEPKVLDFGVARTLRAEDLATVVTRLAMTPAYASPEQIRGQPLSIASDVYSLGVLLFQLLTGRKPFDTGTQAMHELARRVCEEEPPPPSRVVLGRGSEDERVRAVHCARRRGTTPERLRRKLADDLDDIVLMALRKEPARRYASAEQLAADVQRRIAGQPVIARRDTLAYRIAKFTKRHRVGLATALLVAAALGQALVVQRRSLARERGFVDEMQAQLTALFDAIDWSKEAAQLEAVQLEIPPLLLERSPRLRRLIELVRQGEELASRVVYRNPRLQIEHLEQLATAYAELAQGADSRRMWEQVLRRLRSLPERDLLHEARALHRLGRVEQALEIRQSLLPEPHRELAESLNALAGRRRREADFDAAEQLYARSRRMLEDVAGELDEDLIGWMMSESSFLHRRNRNVEGLAMKSEALARSRRLGDRLLEASALLSRGWLLQDMGRHGEALRDTLEADRIYSEELAEGHPLRTKGSHALSLLLKDMGRFLEAHEHLERVVATKEHNYGPASNALWNSYYDRGRLLADEGRWAEAESWTRLALEVVRLKHGEQASEYADVQTTLGRILVRLGRAEEALVYLEPALRLRSRKLDPEFWELHKTRSVLGEALVRLGRCREAGELLADSVPRIAASRGEHHYRTAQAWRRLAVWAERCGRPDLVAAYRACITPRARLSPIVQATVP